MELWGGVECTVNRVGDRYSDQLLRNGHDWRDQDLERFSSLGLKAIRYPVLWERTAPNGLSRASWDWADRRLNRLAELGIRPIVGLVHHGSGPRDTSLLDEDFPKHLAEFAGAVAHRYPWLSLYTPVNEPLTTARFSGLYGHWYPHGREDRSFLRALVVQCRAVILSMKAIRSINPSAQLLQTEDAGKTYSTQRLEYQAELENHRRLLSLDLLTGNVGPGHPLSRYLCSHGVTDEELTWFTENSCPPDVIGINYYLTSDRMLDERVERYPSWSHGGNGRDVYADVSAVNIRPDGITGFETLLTEMWRRYRIPVCVSEVHLGCTREEQLRWLNEAWNGARAAAVSGTDVRAVTVWALLGAYDWNRLVAEEVGFYESGVFDVRGPTPRPTALARMVAALSSRQSFEHPLLINEGWWRRTSRFQFPSFNDEALPRPVIPREQRPTKSQPLMIVGAQGTLGRAYVRLCFDRGIDCVALSRRELDIADHEGAIDTLLQQIRPWAVINAAGYVRVDEAEAENDRCLKVNAIAVGHLASACQRHGVKLLTYSSDLVFDGTRTDPYVESDPLRPLNVYGRSKVEAERLVAESSADALIIRTSAFFGPWDSYNFVSHVVRHLGEGRSIRTSADIVSPTYIPDLVQASLDLLIDEEQGIWHVANQGAVSWYGLAKTTAALSDRDGSMIEVCHPRELGWSAIRPAYSALGSERGRLLPTWEESLERYLWEVGRSMGTT